jgi:hypothetical protein
MERSAMRVFQAAVGMWKIILEKITFRILIFHISIRRGSFHSRPSETTASLVLAG